jgi:hypothetical protein
MYQGARGGKGHEEMESCDKIREERFDLDAAGKERVQRDAAVGDGTAAGKDTNEVTDWDKAWGEVNEKKKVC